MLNILGILCGQSVGCRKNFSQEGLFEDIKGYFFFWEFRVFVQGVIVSGGGEGNSVLIFFLFLYIKKNKIYLSNVCFVNFFFLNELGLESYFF